MARTGTAANYGDITYTSVTAPTNCSIHCWFRSSVAPTTDTFAQPLGIYGVADGLYQAQWTWRHTDITFVTSFSIVDATPAAVVAKCTSTLVANQWYALGGTYDGTNCRVYLNGTNEATTVSGGGVRTGVAPSLVARCWFTDRVAEAGFWNVALTAGEMRMLASGVSPLYIRSANLLGYWPLYGAASPETDMSGNGRNGTPTLVTLIDHAPVRPLTGGELWAPYWVAQPAIPPATLGAMTPREQRYQLVRG